VSTADGFTSSITNYDPAFTWAATSTAGTVQIGSTSTATAPITVTGLAAGQSATVTVTTARTDYQGGSGQVTGSASAVGAALTPTFGAVTPTATGFTVPVTNYNAAWTWTPTPSAGSASIGGTGVITVTGLTLGQSSTVTVTTTRVGYQTGSAPVTGTAAVLATGVAPTFGPVTRTATGFRVAVTNYSAVSTYAFSPTAGSAAWLSAAVGTSRTLVVTGLTPGQSSTVTVTVSRPGFTDGVGSVTGSALAAGVAPTFGAVAPRVDGFRVSVTNYTAGSTYTLTTNRGQVAWLSAAAGGARRLAVTGLSLGQTATVTVRVARAGSTTAVGTVTGTAARTVAAPTLTGVARNAAGTRLTAVISNYSSSNSYTCSAVRSSGGTPIGVCTVNLATRVVTVTGLTAGVLVNLTVTASRSGYLPGKVTRTNV
jgi:titin